MKVLFISQDEFMQIKELQKMVSDFRDARDWKQFHNPKDLSSAIAIEAGELQEHFLWKKGEDSFETSKKEDVADELADIFNYVLLFADCAGIDIEKAFLNKLEKNNTKYSVEKAKGRSDKYTNL